MSGVHADGYTVEINRRDGSGEQAENARLENAELENARTDWLWKADQA